MESLFWSVVTESSIVIQIIMLLLAIMSLASWSIIFYKALSLGTARRQCDNDYETFQSARDLTEAMRSLSTNKDSSVYMTGFYAVRELRRLEQADLPPDAKSSLAIDNVRRALRQGLSFEMSKMNSTLPFLSTCANVAPFLGLFGTVWGIMRSFHAIGAMKTASLAVVGPGIAEALTTTVVGLIVAIPATVAYNAFVGRLGRIETTLVNFADAFLNRMQRELTWAAKAKAGTATKSGSSGAVTGTSDI